VCSGIERFIRDETRRAGASRVVVGLSGGIDSALATILARRALGRDGVIAVLMPYRRSHPDSREDAEDLARRLGIRYEIVDISPMVDAYFEGLPAADRVRRGNKMARERMSVLFDLAAAQGALVLGTSNRTEILLGYGTHFGDTACSLNPIGNLYKTHVRQLGLYLDVPERIRRKTPTADLWPGQADEAELGYAYEEIDRLLVLMVDRGLKPRQLTASGFAPGMVHAVQDRVRRNEFKRRMPLIAPISSRR
jgi:NAD+ synthase